MLFMILLMVLSALLPCAAPALRVTEGAFHKLQPFMDHPSDEPELEVEAVEEVEDVDVVEGWLGVLATTAQAGDPTKTPENITPPAPPAQKAKAEIPAAVTASLVTVLPPGENTGTVKSVRLPMMLTR